MYLYTSANSEKYSFFISNSVLKHCINHVVKCNDSLVVCWELLLNESLESPDSRKQIELINADMKMNVGAAIGLDLWLIICVCCPLFWCLAQSCPSIPSRQSNFYISTNGGPPSMVPGIILLCVQAVVPSHIAKPCQLPSIDVGKERFLRRLSTLFSMYSVLCSK